jgi:hypothetical protein
MDVLEQNLTSRLSRLGSHADVVPTQEQNEMADDAHQGGNHSQDASQSVVDLHGILLSRWQNVLNGVSQRVVFAFAPHERDRATD